LDVGRLLMHIVAVGVVVEVVVVVVAVVMVVVDDEAEMMKEVALS
jgi:hypothetical protein